MRKGFTLVELLTVIGIIAVLAAIIFPVFSAAKRRGKAATCVSNVHQIGLSILAYAEDNGDQFPFAVDPSDKFTPQIWARSPDWQALIPTMPFLQEVLQPYEKSREIWKCPADNGFKVEDFTDEDLWALPSAYAKFGTSYVWRTEIAFRHIRISQFQEGPRVNVIFDAAGHWHLGWPPLDPSEDYMSRFDKRKEYVYNVLFGDMHVKQSTFDQVEQAWMVRL
jgi:general secretion pathway protein G